MKHEPDPGLQSVIDAWPELSSDVPDQFRTILSTYREVVFTQRFPDRTLVPKTLIFAKDDSQASIRFSSQLGHWPWPNYLLPKPPTPQFGNGPLRNCRGLTT